MGVSLGVIVHVLTLAHQHVLTWSLEGLMHVVNLAVGSNATTLGDNLLLVHQLAAARCDGSAAAAGRWLLEGRSVLALLVYAPAEGAARVLVINLALILGLAGGQLVSVVAAV